MKHQVIYCLLILIAACNIPPSSSTVANRMVVVGMDTILEDGWYIIAADKNGVARSAWGDTVLLEPLPLIRLTHADINASKYEMELIYKDSISHIWFYLTNYGMAKYNTSIKYYTHSNIYFVLNDSIINFSPIHRDVNTSALSLTMSIADFEMERIRYIDSIVTKRLNDEH